MWGSVSVMLGCIGKYICRCLWSLLLWLLLKEPRYCIPNSKYWRLGGTVAEAVAPTAYRLDAHGGHRFESGPLSFLLSTPHLFSLSFPVTLFTVLLIKGKKAPNKSLKQIIYIGDRCLPPPLQTRSSHRLPGWIEPIWTRQDKLNIKLWQWQATTSSTL